MSYSYYIYYRVDPSQAATAKQRIEQLLDSVKTATGVAGRLLKKRGEPNLWMEVYENITENAKFESALAGVVNKSNATQFLLPGGGRRLECFED